MLAGYALPVVFNSETPPVFERLSAYFDDRRLANSVVFNRIGDEILEDTLQQSWIRIENGELATQNACTGLSDRKVFEMLGAEAKTKPCKAMASLIEEGKETIEKGSDKELYRC